MCFMRHNNYLVDKFKKSDDEDDDVGEKVVEGKDAQEWQEHQGLNDFFLRFFSWMLTIWII